MNPIRLLAIARKEFIHVLRDWRSLYLAIAIPLLLILLFGYALTLDLSNVPTVVLDRDQSPESRDLISAFAGSPYYSVAAYVDDYATIEELLNKGEVMVAMVIPVGFAEDIIGGREASVQVIADGSDANTARMALNYAIGIGQAYNGRLMADFLGIDQREWMPPVVLSSRVWYNQDLRSQNVILPGIVALVMIVIAAMLTSITIAKEWEMGTMEQLISTPVRGPELIFGKVIPYFVIGMVDVIIAVLLGEFLFHVPMRGSWLLLFSVASVFLFGALFFGMTLSVVLKTQVLANQAALIGGFLPTLLLSGFVFAIENMPKVIQIITYLVPARYFIALMRGIYLKGVGLEVMWLNALLLVMYALFMMINANKRLKLQLE